MTESIDGTSLENTIWHLFDGKYTYPLNIDDMTVCICMHDDKQKCTCMCHKMVGHT